MTLFAGKDKLVVSSCLCHVMSVTIHRSTMVCLKSDIHGHGMPCSSLRNLTHLQSLNLSQNKLEELPAGLFDGLGLTIIDLSHNNLTVVDAQLFDLEKLTTLDLRGNPLTESTRRDLARLTVELHVD